MPDLKITPSGGREFLIQINPDRITQNYGMRPIEFPAMREGIFVQYGGRRGELMTLKMWLPGCATSLMNPDRWFDPQEFIHQLQATFNPNDRAKVFINFPYSDIFAWYLLQDVTEEHYGGFGDIDLTLSVTELRELVIQTVAEITGLTPPEDQTTQADVAPPPPDQPVPSSDDQSYTIADGDTLWAIANRFYGDGSLWRTIWDANTDTIPDPNNISAGTSISIPAAPATSGR